jgi:hypothetical protein
MFRINSAANQNFAAPQFANPSANGNAASLSLPQGYDTVALGGSSDVGDIANPMPTNHYDGAGISDEARESSGDDSPRCQDLVQWLEDSFVEPSLELEQEARAAAKAEDKHARHQKLAERLRSQRLVRH